MPTKHLTKEETEKLYKAFPITSVCRADLLSDGYSEEQVARLDDSAMARLAGKMADAYCDGQFWEDLGILADYALEDEEKEAKELKGISEEIA